MLKKVELRKIASLRDYNSYERIQRVSFEKMFDGAEEAERFGVIRNAEEIEDIIVNYINIQHALSIYAQKIPEDASDEHVALYIDDMETLNLIGDISLEEQLRAIRKIFDDVAAYQDEEGITIEVKVMNPSLLSLKIFRKLKAEERLNKWLVSLMYEPSDDVKKISAFQVHPSFPDDMEEDIENMMREFVNDPFTQYLLVGEQNRTIKRAVKASGSLEELGNNVFLNLFSFLVNSLFVYVEKEENQFGKKQFNKYITWFEKGEFQGKYTEDDLVPILNAVAFLTNFRTARGAKIRFVTDEQAKEEAEKEAIRRAKLRGEKIPEDN